MVKSKRSKVIPLTKTKKSAGAEKKDKIYERVQNLSDEYDYIYVFTYKNMTNFPMQELKRYWKDAV